MSKQINQLEKLMHLYTPAQVAVWLGLADPRPIQKWISRKKIPRVKLERVKLLLKEKGNGHVVIRDTKRKKKGAI